MTKFFLTVDAFADFLKEIYDENPEKYSGQRLGQMFCDHFNITDDQLFHETDRDKALNMIVKYMFTENRD